MCVTMCRLVDRGTFASATDDSPGEDEMVEEYDLLETLEKKREQDIEQGRECPGLGSWILKIGSSQPYGRHALTSLQRSTFWKHSVSSSFLV